MVTFAPLGIYKEASLSQGTIRYHDQGSGQVLVFIHGVFVNSALWRQVIPPLAQQFRCIAPDLPLGGHTMPMRSDADLTPLGMAQIVTDFLEALDLQDVTLVGNDTGGAICQLVIAHHPERITRLVLTNCDAYEQFFPLLIRPLQYGARFLGTRFTDFLAWILQAQFAQRLFAQTVALRKPDQALLDAYFTPLLQVPEVRRDLTRFMSAISNRYTLAAARTFPNFHHPVLIMWGKSDIFFSTRIAIRLHQAFPDATLEFLAHSRAFVPEDQPEPLAKRIAEFMHATIQP